MELAGSIAENLQAAVRSARRLRGHAVHGDTVTFWHQLLSYSRAAKRSALTDDATAIEQLIADLQTEVVAHEGERTSVA